MAGDSRARSTRPESGLLQGCTYDTLSLSSPPSFLLSSPPVQGDDGKMKHPCDGRGGEGMYKCKRPAMTKHKSVVAISYFTLVKGSSDEYDVDGVMSDGVDGDEDCDET